MDLAQLNATRIQALQTAIAALLLTHPDPARFADLLEQLHAQQQIDQAQHALPDPAERDTARQVIDTLCAIAREDAAMRAVHGGL